MFFSLKRKRQSSGLSQKRNLPERRAFIFTGSQLDMINMQTLLDMHNIQYSTVNAYYEIDLVLSNTVLLQDMKGISYMQEQGDCYKHMQYYLVLPKGKQLIRKPNLEPNIHIINYEEDSIIDLLELDKKTSA